MDKKDFFEKRDTKRKSLEESLRAELREAHVYYRDALSMIFKVAAVNGAVFAGLITLYVTLSGKQYTSVQFMKKYIVISGMLISILSLAAQVLAIRMFNISSKHYLNPLRQSLGLPKGPRGKERRNRKFVEHTTSTLLYFVNLVYFVVWLSIFLLNHYNQKGVSTWI